MKRHRRKFTAEQKAAILREHLIDKIPVSDLCEKHGLQPTVFYRWQKDLFENAPQLLEHKNKGLRQMTLERKIETLEAKLSHKDAVIAEILEDHLQLKKELGEL